MCDVCMSLCCLKVGTVCIFSSLRYDAYKSFVYLVGHVSRNYAILHQCFSEVSSSMVSLVIPMNNGV